jgi:glutathione S-transferase
MATCGWCGEKGKDTEHVVWCRRWYNRRPSDAEMAEARRNLSVLRERLAGDEPDLTDVYLSCVLRVRDDTDMIDLFEAMARSVWERGEDMEILEVESDVDIPEFGEQMNYR